MYSARDPVIYEVHCIHPWILDWFVSLAARIGDFVPVRAHQQRTVDGRVTRYYSPEDNTLLPVHLIWGRLHEEMLDYVGGQGLEVAVPAASTMGQLLAERWPTICIHSVRSNVCDECAIDRSRRRTTPTAGFRDSHFNCSTNEVRIRRPQFVSRLILDSFCFVLDIRLAKSI
jgi:hypothetical protein